MITIGEVKREGTLDGGVRKGRHHHTISREAVAKVIAARKMFQKEKRELLVATRLVIRTTQ